RGSAVCTLARDRVPGAIWAERSSHTPALPRNGAGRRAAGPGPRANDAPAGADTMSCYDIFNGDADGICALHQLRLETPREAQLVTGAKREIRLVERVEAGSGDELTVLDVSFDSNRQGVLRALEAGARVRYFDHHFAGDIPHHVALEANIDTASDVCTSLIVDRTLNGRHRAWAVVAAFGDNLAASAMQAAALLGLAPHALEQLRELGECINYNTYGESDEDLHYHLGHIH